MINDDRHQRKYGTNVLKNSYRIIPWKVSECLALEDYKKNYEESLKRYSETNINEYRSSFLAPMLCFSVGFLLRSSLQEENPFFGGYKFVLNAIYFFATVAINVSVLTFLSNNREKNRDEMVVNYISRMNLACSTNEQRLIVDNHQSNLNMLIQEHNRIDKWRWNWSLLVAIMLPLILSQKEEISLVRFVVSVFRAFLFQEAIRAMRGAHKMFMMRWVEENKDAFELANTGARVYFELPYNDNRINKQTLRGARALKFHPRYYSSGELWSRIEQGKKEIIELVSKKERTLDLFRLFNTFFPPFALVDPTSIEPAQEKNKQQKTVNINSNIIREDIPRL